MYTYVYVRMQMIYKNVTIELIQNYIHNSEFILKAQFMHAATCNEIMLNLHVARRERS